MTTPSFFFGNFDFEHHLATAGFHPSAKLLERNAELATSWLSLADDGDYVWCPLRSGTSFERFLQQIADQGLPRIRLVCDLSEVPADVEFVPWGWTQALRGLVARRQWLGRAPEIDVVREVNSRHFSYELETRCRMGLPGSSAVRELARLESAVEQAKTVSPRVILKANWGMSGRERMVVDGPLTEVVLAWVQRRLLSQGVVFVEPWVSHQEEVGIQVHIPEHGASQLVGVTRLISDDKGQYRGSVFALSPAEETEFHERWRLAIEMALEVADRLRHRGYFGPLGIDAMRYQSSAGTIALRPLQDINARWTMGRLSLGWRRFLQPGEWGLWWQGRDDWETAAESFPKEPRRVITVPNPLMTDAHLAFVSRVIIFGE